MLYYKGCAVENSYLEGISPKPPTFPPPPSSSSQVIPLHLECWEGHLKVVETLLTYKADVTNVDLNGFTAFDIALKHSHE